MDLLESLGLRIDQDENLRIISDETEQGSTGISNKIKLIMSNLTQLGRNLDEAVHLLKTLDGQTNDSRIQKLASRIAKIQHESD